MKYLRHRIFAFALQEVRAPNQRLLDIAINYGFSSHESFRRACKKAYGILSSAYRKHPAPLALRAKINSFDRYFLEFGEIGIIKSIEIKNDFIAIPAHKFSIFKIIKTMVIGTLPKIKSHFPDRTMIQSASLLSSTTDLDNRTFCLTGMIDF